MARSSRLRDGMLVTVLVIALVGGIFYVSTHRNGVEAHVCHPALPIRMVGDRTVAVETKPTEGGPCPIDKTNRKMDTLGLDCKVRAPNGKVIETVPRSGADNSC